MWIPTVFLTIFGGVFLTINFLPRDGTITFISFAFTFFLAFFIQRFTSKAIVEVTLTRNDISFRWLSQHIFQKHADRTILLSEIESYKYQPDSNFDLFKLTMKDGTQVKLWHFGLSLKDDFALLVIDFPKIVCSFNERVAAKGNSQGDGQNAGNRPLMINRESTIYEGGGATLIAAFAVVIILAVPLILYFNPSGKKQSTFVLVAPMAGAIFFLMQYFKHQKRKNAGT